MNDEQTMTTTHDTRRSASERDRAAVSAWLEAARLRLLEVYPVERAARATVAAWFIGQRVMLDGEGLEVRPVAVRDLVVWGAAGSAVGGSKVLRDLEAAGVLEAASDYDIAAPLEARRWSVPRDLRDSPRAAGGMPVEHLDALTSPGCAWIAPTLRVVLWSVLSAPASVSVLSAGLRCTTVSVRRWLRRLEGAGLVERSADGVWSAAVEVERLEAVAGAALEAAGAVERLEAARGRVSKHRAVWRHRHNGAALEGGRL